MPARVRPAAGNHRTTASSDTANSPSRRNRAIPWSVRALPNPLRGGLCSEQARFAQARAKPRRRRVGTRPHAPACSIGLVRCVCGLGLDLPGDSRGAGQLAAVPAWRGAFPRRRRCALRVPAPARHACTDTIAMAQCRHQRNLVAWHRQRPGLLRRTNRRLRTGGSRGRQHAVVCRRIRYALSGLAKSAGMARAGDRIWRRHPAQSRQRHEWIAAWRHRPGRRRDCLGFRLGLESTPRHAAGIDEHGRADDLWRCGAQFLLDPAGRAHACPAQP